MSLAACAVTGAPEGMARTVTDVHAGGERVVAVVLELPDGSLRAYRNARGTWWVGSGSGRGWSYVVALRAVGVLYAVHHGPACFGHTDYYVAAPVLEALGVAP